jgi:hypothetical protein
MFTHPWDKPTAPCRFGAGCTRRELPLVRLPSSDDLRPADCHFSHPPGHNPYKAGARSNSNIQYKSFGPPKGGNRTAVFNTAGPTSTAEKLKATEEEKAALSDRMKKFSVGAGETERIIPGQGQAQDATSAGEQATVGGSVAPMEQGEDQPPVKKEENN